MTTNSMDMASMGRTRGISSLASWFSRLVLVPPMIIMVLIAVRYIGNPTQAASPTGVILSTPEALTDTRAVAGFTLTLAFVIALSVFTRGNVRTGNATVVVLMGLVLAVRLFGFAHDGTTLAMGDQKVKTFGEIVFMTLNTVAFLVQTRLYRQIPARS